MASHTSSLPISTELQREACQIEEAGARAVPTAAYLVSSQEVSSPHDFPLRRSSRPSDRIGANAIGSVARNRPRNFASRFAAAPRLLSMRLRIHGEVNRLAILNPHG